ncbi:MAG: hypothetical protein NXI12_00355 [Alphaproteobacteria bacterium]|nr:hypothetical protein [Alphaproteobacteria bacterium]
MTDPWFAAAAIAAALSTGLQEAEPSAPQETAPDAVPATPSTPDPIRENAETYAAYHADVGEAGRRPLLSGADLDATMDALAQYYDGDRLVDAQIAYAALVAAQHPEFIDAVRAVADYYGTETARAALTNDPVYVTGFMGADVASASVVGALEEDAQSIRGVGDRYRQEAYALQNETWAARRARDREDRLAALETASERLDVQFRLAPEAGQTESGTPTRLGAASALGDNRPPAGVPALPELSVTVGEQQLEPDERRVGRMLAVAALQSIEDGDMTTLDRMLAEPSVERCINWARLTMAQCVAAGHFKYEDSFCIAEHALMDVADCLTATRPVSN